MTGRLIAICVVGYLVLLALALVFMKGATR